MQPEYPESAGARDTLGNNRQIIFGIVLTGILMSVLDAVMVNIALPSITRDFGVPVSLVQWTITGYIVALTSLLVIFGKLSEKVGKARMFLFGLVIFTVGSCACGFAMNLPALILFRVIQGIGGAMIYGVTGAVMYLACRPDERGKAMGYLSATISAGVLAGPSLGGFITEFLGWKYIFLVNVPIGIVLICCACRYLKIPETTTDKLNVDWTGAITLILAIVTLLLTCGELAGGISPTPALFAYGALFIVALMAFIAREYRCDNPLVDLSVFRSRIFMLPVISLMLYFVAIHIISVIGPFYFEGVMGYTPSQVGMIFMLVPLVTIVVSPISGWLYDRNRWKYAAALGIVIIAGSCFLQGSASITLDLGIILAAFVLRGLGSGIFQSPNFTEIMNALPEEKAAIASSVSSTARNLGMALGVSLGGVLLTLELGMSGYQGPVLSAPQGILAGTVGGILVITGIVCLVSALISCFGSRESRNSQNQTADREKRPL